MTSRTHSSSLFPYTTLFRSKAPTPGFYKLQPQKHGSNRQRSHHGVLIKRDVVSCVERSEEHTSELQSHSDLVCRLLLEKKNKALIFITLMRPSLVLFLVLWL